MSRPSRTRGLKQWLLTCIRRRAVASLADAWIETWRWGRARRRSRSRPSRTRGLKHLQSAYSAFRCTSRPSRTRGLKLPIVRDAVPLLLVASLADAWIETSIIDTAGLNLTSRPSRTRGLKPGGWFRSVEYLVASLADAWIETRIWRLSSMRSESRVPRGRVD